MIGTGCKVNPPPPLAASQLLPGQSLAAGQGLTSPSGRFLLAMQRDGNLVLYDLGNGNVAYWASNTAGSGADAVTMQPDGNLVVAAAGRPVWSATAGNHVPGSYAVLQDDGNLPIYFRQPEIPQNAVWSSATSTSPGFLAGIAASLSSAADAVVSVVHEVPGVDWIGARLQDFARTAFGQWFLRIVATSTSAGLAPALGYYGPQLASVAFAIPGLARGDTFAQSWTQEEIWRIQQTAQILAGGAAQGLSDAALAELGPYLAELKGLADQLEAETASMLADVAGDANQLPGLVVHYAQQYGEDALAELAKHYLARQDLTQAAVDAIMGTHSFATPAFPARPAPGPFGASITLRAIPAQAGKTFDPLTGLERTAGPSRAAVTAPYAGRFSGAVLSTPTSKAAALQQWVDHYLHGGPAPA